MITIALESWSEDRLRVAAEERGMSPEAYAGLILDTFIRTGLDPRKDPAPLYLTATAEEWEAETAGLIEGPGDSLPSIPDEALRREHVYED